MIHVRKARDFVTQRYRKYVEIHRNVCLAGTVNLHIIWTAKQSSPLTLRYISLVPGPDDFFEFLSPLRITLFNDRKEFGGSLGPSLMTTRLEENGTSVYVQPPLKQAQAIIHFLANLYRRVKYRRRLLAQEATQRLHRILGADPSQLLCEYLARPNRRLSSVTQTTRLWGFQIDSVLEQYLPPCASVSVRIRGVMHLFNV